MKPLTQRALLATAVWAAVSAQTASAQLEEVLVTAERREANLQDTPISITTFSDQEIIDRGINSADDLITQVAGVYGYTPPGSAGSPGFNIRGIGDGASTNLSLDTAVAKYIDGVYLGKGQGSGVDMIDLARIEILKGPQGTLFGRNSTGGTLNFITRHPAPNSVRISAHRWVITTTAPSVAALTYPSATKSACRHRVIAASATPSGMASMAKLAHKI